MIQITMIGGNYVCWEKDQYTDYMYDGKVFVIIKGSQWVGIYNIDQVKEIRIDKYRQFRKLLIKNGFIMLQESVYCKMMTSPSVENSVKQLIKKNKPPEGLVQMLVVTEKQFSKMEYVVGEYTNDIIDSEDRLIIL